MQFATLACIADVHPIRRVIQPAITVEQTDPKLVSGTFSLAKSKRMHDGASKRGA